MSENAIFCPRCDSNQAVKNGFIHNGNQNFKCKQCQRQFVRNPRNKVIGEETKDLIDKLLLEKLPLAGIARITLCVECDGYRLTYVNRLYASILKNVEVWFKKLLSSIIPPF